MEILVDGAAGMERQLGLVAGAQLAGVAAFVVAVGQLDAVAVDLEAGGDAAALRIEADPRLRSGAGRVVAQDGEAPAAEQRLDTFGQQQVEALIVAPAPSARRAARRACPRS